MAEVAGVWRDAFFPIAQVPRRLRISGTVAHVSKENILRKKKCPFTMAPQQRCACPALRSCLLNTPLQPKEPELLEVIDSRSGQKEYKVILEHFGYPKARKCSKRMKEQRSQPKRVPNSQSWNNLSNKTTNSTAL